MTIPPNEDNITNVTDTNTFRVWFDATNSLIQKVNPLEIYGVTAGSGEVAGITIDINRATGAAVVGLDLPLNITGDHIFVNAITFANEVRFAGTTVDAHGATFFGNLVRSFNGQTGDITAALTGIGLPGGIENGDILVYSPNGSTLVAYSLFGGGTFENNAFARFGGSGGLILGSTGSGYGSVSQNKGNVQLFGVTGAQISLFDNSFDPNTSEPEAGGHIFFGRIGRDSNDPMGLVYTGGKTSGFESNSNAPYIVVQHSDRKIGLLGITNPGSPIEYKSRDQSGDKSLDFKFTDSGGVTSGIRIFQSNFAKSNEGAFNEAKPEDKGLKTKKSLRVISGQQNVAVELDNTSDEAKTNFTVFGQGADGASFSPVLNVRNTGDVVIGGLTASDGQGSTFGSLNIVSGKLLVGGTLGDQSGNGVQVLASSGVTTGYKTIFPNTIPFTDDTITETSYKNNFGSDGIIAQLGYRCAGGDAMVTNKTITADLLPEMCGNFSRIASPAGVTYAPIDARFIKYSSNSVRSCVQVGSSENGLIGDSDGDASDYRLGLDKSYSDVNPYDTIFTFKDEDGNNLVGDFDIQVKIPPGLVSSLNSANNSNIVNRNLVGVAVFVDFTDDDLHGLTLGVRNLQNFPNNNTQPGPPENSTFPGNNGESFNIQNNLQSGGNPRSNLAPRDSSDSELHSRILFCYPHGRFGEDDPCGGMLCNVLSGGRLAGIDAMAHAHDRDGPSFTFASTDGIDYTLSGTCLRRLQILPFYSKNPKNVGTLQGYGTYEFNNNGQYDPYFPVFHNFPRDNANDSIGNDFGMLALAKGFIKGTFKQVEVD